MKGYTSPWLPSPRLPWRSLRSSLGGLLVCLALTACAEPEVTYYQGYVEGEYVYLAAPIGGKLEELIAARGKAVSAGEILFRLDPNPEALKASETAQRLAQAQSKLADIRKGGRPSEIAALDARLASARSAHEQAVHDYNRRKKLRDEGRVDAVSDSELDRFRTARDVRAADMSMLEAELETAQLGGRPDAVAAAEKEVSALGIVAQEIDWQVEQKSGVAPADGVVQDTFYRVGEFVVAGRPVVSMLPPANIKARFFIPEPLLPTIAIGDTVQLQLDGLAPRVPARITYISATAEYTPPVIYSKTNRAKLVFMVE
ncbi:MAG: HlyD family secretion protein, partial [Planctomycetota bacterium]